MKILCRRLDLPDGARLELRNGDAPIAFLEVRGGRAGLDEERPGDAGIPPLAAGDVLTLVRDGVAVLRGGVHRD